MCFWYMISCIIIMIGHLAVVYTNLSAIFQKQLRERVL